MVFIPWAVRIGYTYGVPFAPENIVNRLVELDLFWREFLAHCLCNLTGFIRPSIMANAQIYMNRSLAMTGSRVDDSWMGRLKIPDRSPQSAHKPSDRIPPPARSLLPHKQSLH